jgi:hypothetical protein
MDLVSVVIWIIVLCAIGAIVWWALGHFNVPQPFIVVAVAVIAILALLLLVQLLPGGSPRIPAR